MFDNNLTKGACAVTHHLCYYVMFHELCVLTQCSDALINQKTLEISLADV